jgi:hypothetical protein
MSYSTNCAPTYFRANMMDLVTYPIVNANGSVSQFTERDPFTLMLHLFIEKLTVFQVEKYTGQQFTTLVYKKYGNTTMIWIVLMVNGLLSRTELRSGMMLRWPIKEQIDAVMQEFTLNKPFETTVLI